MSTNWIIAETTAQGAELISALKVVGGEMIIAFTLGDEVQAKDMISRGANQAFSLPVIADAPWEAYVPTLAEKAKAEPPKLILTGSTKRCRTMAAWIAGLIDVPCLSDVKNLVIDGAKIRGERTVMGGLATKMISTTAPTVVAIIGSGLYPEAVVDHSRSGLVSVLAAVSGVKVTARRPKEVSSVNLPLAKRVVSVGRGFAEKADLSFAEDLAKALGAELACSRPIAEFSKWMPEERYVGISGQVVKPDVYVAVGISGQAQHVYGIRDSRIIVSVNKDEAAPIHQIADYAIVGDFKQVLPELCKALAQR